MANGPFEAVLSVGYPDTAGSDRFRIRAYQRVRNHWPTKRFLRKSSRLFIRICSR